MIISDFFLYLLISFFSYGFNQVLISKKPFGRSQRVWINRD
ncbi:hypothetical protein PROVRETT_05316 [Providencia rettgeri DSM 1131]|nr:hypothetical protein PROVRETT_05316 [Providencia rettgeri DSM 1131]